MCILLLTSSHPSYALILLSNRDEFIHRPTSRPYWWSPEDKRASSLRPSSYSSPPPSTVAPLILSSRDLQRPEQGTWLGITSTGKLAVLTNYRDSTTSAGADSTPTTSAAAAAPATATATATEPAPAAPFPADSPRSRGALVTAWLGGPATESAAAFVSRLLETENLGAFDGFSLVCGRLRRRQRQRAHGHDGRSGAAASEHSSGAAGCSAPEDAAVLDADDDDDDGNYPDGHEPGSAASERAHRLEPLAIVSNRSGCDAAGSRNNRGGGGGGGGAGTGTDNHDHHYNHNHHDNRVPWLRLGSGGGGAVYGLSNTSYADPEPWPKVELGRRLLREAVASAAAAAAAGKAAGKAAAEDALIARLFAKVLDHDTMPRRAAGESFTAYLAHLRRTVFVPPLRENGEEGEEEGEEEERREQEEDDEKEVEREERRNKEEKKKKKRAPAAAVYGTQRQTVVLVDWEGRVRFVERSLWDAEGGPVERGKGDVEFEFRIEGW